MCLIKSFVGLYGYKDVDSIEAVVNYAFRSQYYAGFIAGNINGCDDFCQYPSIENIIQQFYSTYSLRPDMQNKSKIHHFEVSFADAALSEGAVKNLMELLRNYFKKRYFQVLVVRHSGSNKDAYNQHFHVIVNHCNLKGALWYGTNSDYVELKEYLKRATHYPWNGLDCGSNGPCISRGRKIYPDYRCVY